MVCHSTLSCWFSTGSSSDYFDVEATSPSWQKQDRNSWCTEGGYCFCFLFWSVKHKRWKRKSRKLASSLKSKNKTQSFVPRNGTEVEWKYQLFDEIFGASVCANSAPASSSTEVPVSKGGNPVTKVHCCWHFPGEIKPQKHFRCGGLRWPVCGWVKAVEVTRRVQSGRCPSGFLCEVAGWNCKEAPPRLRARGQVPAFYEPASTSNNKKKKKKKKEEEEKTFRIGSNWLSFPRTVLETIPPSDILPHAVSTWSGIYWVFFPADTRWQFGLSHWEALFFLCVVGCTSTCNLWDRPPGHRTHSASSQTTEPEPV